MLTNHSSGTTFAGDNGGGWNVNSPRRAVEFSIIAAAAIAASSAALAEPEEDERTRFIIYSPDAGTSVEELSAARTPLVSFSKANERQVLWSANGTFVRPAKTVVTDVSAPTAQWHDIFSDVARWSKLSPDWGGDDEKPVSEAAFASTKAVLRKLVLARVMKPEHYIDAEGEISLDWKSGDRRASLIIDQSGLVSAYSESADRSELLQIDEASLHDERLDQLIVELRSFT